MFTIQPDHSIGIMRAQLMEVQQNHVTVTINEVATRIDDRDIEGVWIRRENSHEPIVFLECQDEDGGIFTIQVYWSAGTWRQARRYCERVGGCAAINILDEYEKTGRVERNGYRLTDTQLLVADNKTGVDWKDISGVEIVGDDIKIWTRANTFSTLTYPSDAPNSLVLNRVIPAIASVLGSKPECEQHVGQFECKLIHPTHASVYVATTLGLLGTGILRQVHHDYSYLYIAVSYTHLTLPTKA